MKKFLKVYIFIIIITLSLISSCSNKNTTKTNSAQNIVENYFEYKNEKNRDKLLTTLTEDYSSPNVIWGFENLEINIEEEMD